MKINTFEEYDSIYEYRTPGSKNKKKLGPNTEEYTPGEPVSPDETVVAVGDELATIDNYDDFEGEPADDTPSKGAYDIDAPSPEDRNLFKDRKDWLLSYKLLWSRIVARKNFFVQGEAGWAKSAVIKQMAKKAGFTVITVFLDKALPEDLDGLPAVREDKRRVGRVVQEKAMPVWAQYMYDHPKTKFLLFFDELNQASNDVLKALMPISHKDRVICGHEFKNYFCGAAGNLKTENDLEDLPRPVMARFGGKPIRWLTGLNDDPKIAKEAWKQSFEYLHGKYDKELGKDVINAFERECLSYHPTLFAAPRDLEDYIFDWLVEIKEGDIDMDDYDRIDMETIYENIKAQTNTVEGVQMDMKNGNKWTNKIDASVQKLTQVCYNFLDKTTKKKSNSTSSAESDENSVPTEDDFDDAMMDQIIKMMVKGEDPQIVFDDGTPAPITPETIFDFVPELNDNRTMLEVLVKEMHKRGKDWKYPDNEAAIKTGKWTHDDLYDEQEEVK